MRFRKIQMAIDRGLFEPEICELPVPPDSDEVQRMIVRCGGAISAEHLELIREWGGALLDQIRIEDPSKVVVEDGHVLFASDYNGFRFWYDEGGSVIAVDSDGGATQALASSITEFIEEVLLGPRAAAFYGDEWLEELKRRRMA